MPHSNYWSISYNYLIMMRYCRHQLRVTSSQTVFICNLNTQILLLLWPQGTAYSQILLYVSTRCFNQCDIDIINNLSTRWLPMCLNWHLFGLSLQHTRRFDTTNAQEGNLDWTQSGMPHISFQDRMLVFITGSMVVVARGMRRNACSVIPGYWKWVHRTSSLVT